MAIRDLRQTRTFIVLEVSRAAHDEIRTKLEAAGYQHAFVDGGETIDMHGIAIEAEPVPSMAAGSEGRPDAGAIPEAVR